MQTVSAPSARQRYLQVLGPPGRNRLWICPPAPKLRPAPAHLGKPVVPCQTISSTSSVVLAPTSVEAATQPHDSSETLPWTSYWWPVQTVENLNPKIPMHVDLLGKSLVIWGDSQGNWHCLEDKCPHRLAPLSEGRVEKDNIMCCYHGWTFSGSGSCTSIPQLASDPKAHDNACSSKRSCATAYPTHVQNGLLFVWPESGPEAAAKAAATAPTKLVWEGMNPYYVRDVPIRYDTIVENFLDPSHVAYAHHGVIGDRNKPSDNWAHMVVSDIKKDGMLATGNFMGQPVYMQFEPPFKIAQYNNPSRPILQLLLVPMKPGWTRFFFGTAAVPPFLHVLPMPFRWWLRFRLSNPPLDHILSRNAIFDGDNYMLHKAERVVPVSQGIGTAVVRACYMPAADDGMVIALRKWFQQFGGDVPTCSAADEAAMQVTMTKEQNIDRWNQHTKQCAHCLKALATLDKVQAVNVVVGLAAAVALVAQAVAATALTRLASSGSASASPVLAGWAGPLGMAVVSWWQSCHAAGLQGGIMGCTALALVCLGLYRFLAGARQKFFYEEYVHALRD